MGVAHRQSGDDGCVHDELQDGRDNQYLHILNRFITRRVRTRLFVLKTFVFSSNTPAVEFAAIRLDPTQWLESIVPCRQIIICQCPV